MYNRESLPHFLAAWYERDMAELRQLHPDLPEWWLENIFIDMVDDFFWPFDHRVTKRYIYDQLQKLKNSPQR